MQGYVSKNRKFGYRFLPKVACTTIKHALYELEERKNYKAKPGRNIHKYTGKKRVSTMDSCERRIIVLRDPIKRFLSAFGNRVTFHKELSRAYILKNAKKHYDTIPFFNPTLDQFIDHYDIYSNMRSIFHHTRPINFFLEGEDLSYFTNIYTFENLGDLEADLAAFFGRNVAFGHRQAGGKKFFIRDLNEEQILKLLQFYKEDYALMHDYYSEQAVWDEWEREMALQSANHSEVQSSTEQ